MDHGHQDLGSQELGIQPKQNPQLGNNPIHPDGRKTLFCKKIWLPLGWFYGRVNPRCYLRNLDPLIND